MKNNRASDDDSSDEAEHEPTRQHSQVEKNAKALQNEGVVRLKVARLNKFAKNSTRIIQIHAASKNLSLYKLKDPLPQYSLNPSMLISATLSDKDTLKMKLSFFSSPHRLLRSQKEWKIKFESTFERERVYRLLRENMLTKEARDADYVYRPQPLPISDRVSALVEALPLEALGDELHKAWAETKEAQGWKYGPNLDEKAKTHPGLVPWKKLPLDDRKYDLEIARLTLAGIFELGYSIQKVKKGSAKMAEQLSRLIEFLAENAHEAWASRKCEQGWKYGPKSDPVTKTHPSLVPYCDMDDSQQDLDREAAVTILSSLIKWGYGLPKVRKDV